MLYPVVDNGNNYGNNKLITKLVIVTEYVTHLLSVIIIIKLIWIIMLISLNARYPIG